MEWLKEYLGEELYSQVSEKLGDKKVLPSDGSYIPISKFNEVNQETKMLKEKISHFESQSKDVESLLNNNKELSNKYLELQTQTKAQIEAKEKELYNHIKVSKIKDVLSKEKALYPELLLNQINLDYIRLENDSLEGFNVSDLKTKYPSMFTIEKVEGHSPKNEGVPPITSSKKQQLIDKYNKAEQEKNVQMMIRIQQEIKSLKD